MAIDKKKKIGFIIALVILFVLIITFSMFINSKAKVYIEDETAFCSRQPLGYVCVDKDSNLISGIMYSINQTSFTFKNGKLNGIARMYNKNGKLAGETNYKDGKKNGLTKIYYENGKLKGEINYKDENVNGITRIYYENGKLAGETNYKDGKENGLRKSYYKNGQLKEEANYKDGELYGYIKIYDENGKRIIK